MMVDTSAVIAILRYEPDWQFYLGRLESAARASFSVVSYFEASMVLSSSTDGSGRAILDAFVMEAELMLQPVNLQDALLARDAFLNFGKGRHPAALNFGDCFSYALAKRLGEPLLFKGNDFNQTDVLRA